jgi:hypothetical protein
MRTVSLKLITREIITKNLQRSRIPQNDLYVIFFPMHFDDLGLNLIIYSQVSVRQKAFLAEVSTILSSGLFLISYYQFHIETNHPGDCQQEHKEREEVDININENRA